ncbi:MAG: 2-oxoacid:acceptor oxidoreductase family protein [Smithellaceae bacterium]|nr:2-oxoacid:acceptor oxidoreductase family protein [Smithellaceae bacterium]
MKKQGERKEIILAGSGGQGLVVAGIMLAEAAIREGKNVVQTQSYGIASRGGFSMAEVIIDSEEIIFQQVQRPDVILALTPEALAKMQPLVNGEETVIFYDTTLIPGDYAGKRNMLGFPFTELASNLGNVGAVNLIALGAIIARCQVVAPSSMRELIEKRFSGKVAELNIQALATGYGLIAAGS